jgi:pectinesterase
MKQVLYTLSLLFSLSISAQQQTWPTRLTVAQDGSGNYKTIQEAVNAVRDHSQVQVVIFIKNGTYHEKLVIPSWKKMISLIGESRDSTIITNSDYSGKPYPGGKDATGRDKYSTFTSYTVLVQGNDFRAENLTIKNEAGRVGQAVALHVEGDRCIVSHCNLTGNQDTLYVGVDTSRQYYLNCFIEGTTDFIFGPATVVFQDCTIKSLSNSYNWRNPENEKTAYYAEYNSKGAGGNTTGCASWSKQLSKKEANRYTLKNILGNWQPQTTASR